MDIEKSQTANNGRVPPPFLAQDVPYLARKMEPK